jgi:hypothetical protein
MKLVHFLATDPRRGFAGIVLVALLAAALPAFAAKTDFVELVNGDHFTGEVKSLDRGRLKLNTDNAGDVFVEWDKIRRVSAAAQFDFETVSGHHVIGALRGAKLDGQLRVVGVGDTILLGFDSVVRMTPVHSTFWKKVDGSVDLGSSFALSNNLKQLNAAMSATYRERRYSVGSNLNFTLVHQDGVPDTRRGTVDAMYTRYFENRWQGQGQARFEQNDQLGLDLRSSAEATIGRYLKQSNTTLFDASAGLSANQEHSSGGTTTYNLEGLLGLDFSTFVYDSPKVNVDSYIHFYPSLTTWGRMRMEISAVAKREVVKDLFLGLNGVESFDNQPPAGATNHDWNVYFSIGWTF